MLRAAKSRGAKGDIGGGGGKRGGGARDGGGGRGGNAPPKTKSPQLQMAEFRRDETLMFDPVKAAPGALSVVYAYPNDYTVGITSLGYQLVGAHSSSSLLLLLLLLLFFF